MGDLIFLLGVLIALTAGALTPIFIIVKSAEACRIEDADKGQCIVKAGFALAVWGFLSLGIMFLMFVYVYGSAHRIPDAPTAWRWLLTFLSLTIAYGLIGFGLVRLIMPPESILTRRYAS